MLLVYWKDTVIIYIAIAVIGIILSILSYFRSTTLRRWWVREGLNGFYNVKIDDYLVDIEKFSDKI